jgi:hypothetical protein
MYELFYNTLEFLLEKTEPIEQIYVKYVPKLLRFILWPLAQVILGLTVTIAVVIAAIYKLFQFIKKAYDKYE